MKKEEDILIGKRIKDIRSKLKMNQKDFANKINATVSALSNWENGRNKPNDIMLREIAILGDTTISQLLTGIDESDDLYKIGNSPYQDLLNEYDQHTEIGKSLRYFSEKETMEIIISAAKTAVNLSGYSILSQSMKDKRSIEYYAIKNRIKNNFYERYYSSIKNNQNLIALTTNQLDDMIYKVDTYDYLNDDGRYTSLNNTDGLLLIGRSTLGINEKLRSDIEELLFKCKNEIESLKDKYPNERDVIQHRIYFFENDNGASSSVLYIDENKNIDEHSDVQSEYEDVFNQISDLIINEKCSIDEIVSKLNN